MIYLVHILSSSKTNGGIQKNDGISMKVEIIYGSNSYYKEVIKSVNGLTYTDLIKLKATS